jgi:hypothetical protein
LKEEEVPSSSFSLRTQSSPILLHFGLDDESAEVLSGLDFACNSSKTHSCTLDRRLRGSILISRSSSWHARLCVSDWAVQRILPNLFPWSLRLMTCDNSPLRSNCSRTSGLTANYRFEPQHNLRRFSERTLPNIQRRRRESNREDVRENGESGDPSGPMFGHPGGLVKECPSAEAANMRRTDETVCRLASAQLGRSKMKSKSFFNSTRRTDEDRLNFQSKSTMTKLSRCLQDALNGMTEL